MRTKRAFCILCSFLIATLGGAQISFAQSTINASGKIEALSEASLTVSSVAFGITANTRFKDSRGKSTTIASFKVGDSVEVEGRSQENVISADEVEAARAGGGSGGNTTVPDQVKARCLFPNLKTIRVGLTKRILEALAAAGQPNAKVSVRTRLVDKGGIVSIATRDASLSLVPRMNGVALLGFDGIAEPLFCQGVVEVRAKVKTAVGAESEVTSKHTIRGFRSYRSF